MDEDSDYLTSLKEIFPNRSVQVISEIIDLVLENGEDENSLETMINFLAESGESTLVSPEEALDEAAGFGHNLESYEIRRKKECHNIFIQLSEMIPDADPDYLMKESELLVDKCSADIYNFILDSIDSKEYPSRKDYLIRQKNVDEIRKYTTNFTIERFLEVIPNPVEHFCSSTYISSLCDGESSPADEDYALKCLTNLYPYLRRKDVEKVFKKKKNLIEASDTLARIPRYFKTPRKLYDIGEECSNIKLLQELAFIENKNKIKTALKMRDEHYRLAREEAEKFDLLETCQCCYFEGLLPEECYFCKKGCPFCKDCVRKGVEHAVGEGKLSFPCLTTCNSEFDISTLKMVLDKKAFDPLFTKIQMEEVKRANIDGLETCQFCDFSVILSDEQKIFQCQNPDCMETTCRQCRHKSHVPFRCNEIEYDEDVKRRTYIENKMTEALVRICWKCQKSFLKESGCNKMTCPCGAKMCYYCGANNIDYNHFGEISRNQCPLYTRDLKQFHADRVMKSAVRAKEDLGLNENPQLLKIDPTEGLEEYFRRM